MSIGLDRVSTALEMCQSRQAECRVHTAEVVYLLNSLDLTTTHGHQVTHMPSTVELQTIELFPLLCFFSIHRRVYTFLR